MRSIRQFPIETQAVHAGVGEYEFGAVVPPIYQTSTFRFKDSDHGARLFRGEEDGYIYTRMRNPTVEAMESAIAVLEGGTHALGCASGMAAVHTVFMALLSAGDHVLCSDSVYGPTTTLLTGVFGKFGVQVDFIDTSSPENVARMMRPNTKVVYVETPGNPTLVLCDLEAIADIAHRNRALLVVDNTFMSPVLQRPFELGADVILHSMTKFLNGHADVVAGVVVVKSEAQYRDFRRILNQIGGVIDPFNSFLVHRGVKTLDVRVRRQNENAMKVAKFLEGHPKIAWVRYPGLESHPQYELARRQMKGPGAMIACELTGGITAGRALMNGVSIFQLAVSLGGVESLIQHPATMTHASMGKAQREQAKITDGLVRISVGIENVDDLIEDLRHALDGCGRPSESRESAI
ncbi:MAG: methionine gamma-lyase [Bdellovibrionales bacterium GWB1_55_8]|nr:MAG: methionine gamma-lyase [Bdellovibrionales bacterium GWB1_55_8]